MTEEQDYLSPEFKKCSEEDINEMLDKCPNQAYELEDFELYVCKAALHHYPNDRKKQVNMIHVMNTSMVLAEKEGHPLGTVPHKILMELAIKYDVQEAFIDEILEIRKNKNE